MKKFALNIIIMAIVSFILQYSWEYWQCGIFYTMNGDTPDGTLMASATFGDIMMTLALYTLLAIVNKNVNWILDKWELKDYIIMALYALFLSFYFEISALYTGRWGYSEAMPLFPNTNIGLIPVIQLLILFPISFLISRVIIKQIWPLLNR